MQPEKAAHMDHFHKFPHSRRFSPLFVAHCNQKPSPQTNLIGHLSFIGVSLLFLYYKVFVVFRDLIGCVVWPWDWSHPVSKSVLGMVGDCLSSSLLQSCTCTCVLGLPGWLVGGISAGKVVKESHGVIVWVPCRHVGTKMFQHVEWLLCNIGANFTTKMQKFPTVRSQPLPVQSLPMTITTTWQPLPMTISTTWQPPPHDNHQHALYNQHLSPLPGFILQENHHHMTITTSWQPPPHICQPILLGKCLLTTILSEQAILWFDLYCYSLSKPVQTLSKHFWKILQSNRWSWFQALWRTLSRKILI